MIKYSLVCEAGHEDVSWFKDSEAFDKLKKAGQIVCARCGAPADKALMAPAVKKSKADRPTITHEALLEFRRRVEAEADNVGDNFYDEAKKMHRGEKPIRSIYGDATESETRQLRKDGIWVETFPWPKLDS